MAHTLSAHKPIVRGYQLSADFISDTNKQLLEIITDHYVSHVPNLVALYVAGSLVYGGWKEGMSDVDIVAVVTKKDNQPATENSKARLDKLAESADFASSFTYIDSSCIDLQSLRAGTQLDADKAAIVSYAGVCIYGTEQNFDEHLPAVDTFAHERAQRAIRLLNKYESGNIIPAFQKDSRLLSRSTAKAAMRILSSVTLLRGAPLQLDPRLVARDVTQYAPELSQLAQAILSSIDQPSHDFLEVTALVRTAYETYCRETDRTDSTLGV